MAIVVYRCDTCKREIELQRNIEGLEHVGRCNITHGCRGKLYQVNLRPDFIRGSLPDPVTGLDDWKNRKVLHNHQQAVERDEWIIVHNMGVVPTVNVFGDRPIEGNLGNRVEVTPDDVVIVNDNTIKLVFGRPWSGIAQLVANQSDPDLFKTTIREQAAIQTPTQLSNLGEITIATKAGAIDQNTTILLNVAYTTPTNSIVNVQYTADAAPSIASPWVDYDDGAIIKGSIYNIRSFNALIPEMTTGVIGSGSTFRFASIDRQGGLGGAGDIAPGEVLILLASSPYQTVDKINDRYIDVTNVSTVQNPNGFYYNKGELFAIPGVERTVYPLIRSL